MKKKILALVMVLALAATGVVGASMAYLTDEAGEMSNVFAIGNVNIQLTEEVSVDGAGEVIEGEPDENGDDTGARYTGVMPGDYLKKEVTVSNVGDNDAYVAVTVTLNNAVKINNAIDEAYGDDAAQDIYDSVFVGWGLNHSKDLDGDGTSEAGMRLTITGEDMPEHVLQVDSVKALVDYIQFYSGNWFMSETEAKSTGYTAGLNNSFYSADLKANEIRYTYYIDLPAGESTTLFDGLNVPEDFDADQLAMFDGLTIKVSAKAIQADNFSSAIAAFSELNGVPALGVYDVSVANNIELDEAIKAGKTAIYLIGEGPYIIPDSAQRKTLTFGGNNAVIATQDDGSYEGCDYSLDGATVTFNGVTINTDSRTYTGYARLNATYNDCTINGTYTLYGDSEFNNCTFNVSGDVYNIWTWGAPTATFNNCTFNSDGKAMLLYGTVNTKLTMNNCVFNDNGGLTDLKAAIEIGNDYGKSYELILNNITVNGYEINDKGINTGTALWANKNSMGTDKLNVVVDGVDVY